MNPFEAELIATQEGRESRNGIIRVRGARFVVSLELVPDARPGDILLCDAGVAVARLTVHESEKEKHDVSRDPR